MQEERAAPFRYLRCSVTLETLFAYEITGSHLRCCVRQGWGVGLFRPLPLQWL